MDTSHASLAETPAVLSPAPPAPGPEETRPPLTSDHAPVLLHGSAGLAAAVSQGAAWLWQGYLAPGAVTLLTSQWKAGKTTLVSVLLARLKTGGELAGLPLAAGKALVISEEGPVHWHRRSQQLDFGDHVDWYCQPFKAKPTAPQWEAFMDEVLAAQARADYALVVIDPLAAFIAGTENDAGCMLRFLLPLQRLLARGVSVLILHHPGRQDRPPGQAARGSGALSGSADILIEMRAGPDTADLDRRRRLHAFSRFPETPRQLVIEWTPDGTDYRNLGTFQEDEFASNWQTLHALLAEAPRKVTRQEMREQWPSEDAPPASSLTRWLERAAAEGLLRRDGFGRRGQPFRYWLPEREEVWRQDPLALVRMPELFYPDLPPPSLS